MERIVDARGTACPVPFAMAKVALEEIGPEDVLVVLATDPEAPVDIGALAADAGRACTAEPDGAGWRIVVS